MKIIGINPLSKEDFQELLSQGVLRKVESSPKNEKKRKNKRAKSTAKKMKLMR